MCIINNPVELVQNTKLFVSLNKNKDKQIVVYSNKVSNQHNNNAMILPCPNPTSVQFHRMDKYKAFFDDLNKNFRKERVPLRSMTNSFSTDRCVLKSYIKVQDIGSYMVSVVNNIDDFSRINPDYFIVNPDVVEIFKNEYPKEFGYIVCKLKNGKQINYEPLAYSHLLYEKNKVLIPTLHFHPSNDGYNSAKKEKLADDWSHDIYIMNCLASDHNKNLYNKMKNIHHNYIYDKVKNIEYNNIDFDFDNENHMTKLCINGRRENKDLVFEVD